jgi:outer membrane lipoprotein SlyB
MRKFFVLVAIFALALAGCSNGDTNTTGNINFIGNRSKDPTLQINNQSAKELDQVVFQSVLFIKENADVIGTWTGKDITYPNEYGLTLDIADNGWTAVIQARVFGALSGQGNWKRNGNSLTFNRNSGRLSGTATLSGNTLTVHFDVEDMSGGGCTFASTSSNLQKTIKSGNSVTKTVEAGGGYIFFKVNSVDYYTSELVVVEKNDKAVFTFTNNTIVVDVNNPSISVTLGSL